MKKKGKDEKERDPVVATHREAGRDYFVEDSMEAGIVLAGSEVKSLRQAKASLAGSFARVEGSEVYLYNFYIAPYDKSSYDQPEPTRRRKLLLHRSQIHKLYEQTAQKGLVLVPLKLYLKHGLVKVDLGVCRGKKAQDKRSDIKKRSALREIDRAIKNRNRK